MPGGLARAYVSLPSLFRPTGTFLPFCRCEPVRKDIKLVIFEDTPEALDLYSQAFGSLKGVNLVHNKTVVSVREALSVFKRLRPEIVITDLALSKKCNPDGVAILRKIKRIEPSTAVAICTLYASPNDMCGLAQQVRAAGFDRIFAKGDLDGMKSFIEEKVAELRVRSS